MLFRSHWIVYSPEKDEVVGLFTDSTEAVEANRALDRSEKLFKNIFANIPAGVEIYDKDGYLLDLNNKNLEIFGIANKEDVIGINFFENPNVPQTIRDRVRNEDLVDFRLNYSFDQIKGYYRTMRSNVIELYSKVTKLYDREGEFIGYILISIDNTERIDAMNRIRDFENFFLMISDFAKVGYAKLNLLNRKGYAIKQWYKNMGEEEDIALSDVVGVYRKMHPEDRKGLLDFYKEVKVGKRKHFQGEMRILRPGTENEWNWVNTNVMVTQYKPEEGEIEIIGINYDITKLKETEAELIHARDKAEMMDRLKSAFLANMSHEIRTPLNAIVGFSGVLVADDYDAETRREFVEIIQRNSDLLLRLINDILDISRLETGRLKFSLEDTDIVSLGQSVLATTSYGKQNGVEYVFDAPCEQFILRTDVQRLQQILINLLSNANKVTSKGSITLSFEVNEEEDCVYFRVSDTGTGIPEDKQKKVFERFEKLDEYVQGTGLGLAICKLTITMMGGDIWVDKDYKEGARFVVRHPLHVHMTEIGRAHV